MFYIVFALLMFIVSVTVHILFCRKTNKPGLHARVFVLIAIACLGIYVVVVLVLSSSNMLDPYSLWGLPFKITGWIIFVLLVPIYLCFYVLTQLTSPSKKILSTMAQGTEVSYDDILSSVQKENFVTTRLNDLCASGCVTQANGKYTLTSEGRKIAGILKMIQLILGRNVGG